MNTKVVGITFASTMLFATITSGLLLCSSTTHAADDSAVTVTEITVPSSCSMTANVSTPHVADIVNGNRAINIGKTTLSTFCNDPGGFAIYAIGYTNNELGSTDVIASNNTDTIATGNTAPSNNSSWGMKVVNNSSSSFPATITPYFNVATNDGYVAVPNTFTLMASRNSGTAMDSATLLDTTYGAYISTTQPVGEYNGQVLYTMVHPSSAAGPNAGTMFEAAFLMQPTPPAKKTVGSNSYYKMQDMTPDICTVMSIGAEGQMVDDRDDKIYWVLKAKDGKCWMTQNLDHDIVTTANFYTPQNTDVSENWTAERATIPSTSITSVGAFTGWTNDNSNPYSADSGDWYFTDTYYNDACNSDPWCRYTNPNAGTPTTEKFSETPFPGNGEHGHVGNYYNWTAAIASNDSSAYTTSTYDNPSASPQTSICPAGWRLPAISSVSTSNDYLSLANAYNDASSTGTDKTTFASPLYFIRGGYVNSGILNGGGYFGVYYSSTIQSNLKTYYFGLLPNGYNNSAGADRYTGAFIRCVARTGTEPVSVNKAFNDANKTTVSVSGTNYYKMQDMTSSICSNISTEQTGKLIDVRDNTIYTVGKLKDNNCWLLDNLALDLANSTVKANMDQTNTNASNTELNYLKNGGGTTSDRYATAGVSTTYVWSYSAPGYSVANKNNIPTDSMSTEGGWKTGGFYNYCAASAGSYCFGNGASTSGSPSGNATSDICPFGWRMPTGGENSEYTYLYSIYNTYTAIRAALHYPLAGITGQSGSPSRVNEVGNAWTSTKHSGADYMRSFYADNTSRIVANNTDTRLGTYTVRCIAK